MNTDQPTDNYQTESDARTLKEHAQITSDPKRHKKAVAHLHKEITSMKKAHGHSKRMLGRVKGGLQKAFPPEGSPQEEAQETPAEEAMEQGE